MTTKTQEDTVVDFILSQLQTGIDTIGKAGRRNTNAGGHVKSEFKYLR
jgi:hypothetical protein